MERLTFVKGEHRWHQGRNPTPYSSRETFQSVCDRLGKIEDILGDEYDLDRLRELVKSEKEGRRIPSGYALVKMEFLEELEQQAALRREQDY